MPLAFGGIFPPGLALPGCKPSARLLIYANTVSCLRKRRGWNFNFFAHETHEKQEKMIIFVSLLNLPALSQTD
jgi:hypothetical protein